MAEIICIHGIDEQVESSDLLLATWLPAIAGGLRLLSEESIADKFWPKTSLSIEMAFYGDLFRTPDMPLIIQTPDMNEIIRELILSLSNHPWVMKVGMEITEKFLKTSLQQVTTYFSNSSIRAAILQRIEKLLTSDTKIIISHSLGTVIAYEFCHTLNQRLPKLITLGSPLGLGTIITQNLTPPASFPRMVNSWVNLANLDDIIATNPNLTPIFGHGMIPSNSLNCYVFVQDGDTNPHLPETYLGRSVVANSILSFFN